MIQGVKDALAVVVESVFLAGKTGVKHDFFSFIGMALANMVHHGLMDILIHNSFERWQQSEVLVNKLAEGMCRLPHLTDCVLHISSSNEIRKHLVEHGNVVEPKKEVDLCSTACKDECRSSRKQLRR